MGDAIVQSANSSMPSNNVLQGLRILMVDDSPTILAFGTSALEEAGANVRCSEDMWVSQIISEFHPDIILMDVNLGSLANGPIAVKALKKSRNTQHIPIVLYSSTEEQELLKLCMDCGADGYIEKTTDADLLVRRLGNIVQQVKHEHAS